MEEITVLVADYYDVWHKGVMSQLRNRRLVKVRQVSMLIANELTDMPLTHIGKFFKRDHATVIHAIKTVKNDMATDEIFRYEVLSLIEKSRKKLLEPKLNFCNPTTFKIKN